jgi:hypothetical protein
LAHDVFISYSTDDGPVADAICSALESQHISCWIAPRDIPAGVTWAVAIINAIKESRLFILVLSETSNVSPPVMSELDSAGSRGIPIIPVRIDNTPLSEAVEFYTSRYQWFNAQNSPIDQHLPRLTANIQQHLAQAEAARARKQAEEAAREKLRFELEAKERARMEAAQSQVVEADRVKKEYEEARLAAIKARKEAEESALEKARNEAEATRVRQETAELTKALEAARLKAKEVEEAREAAAKARKEAEEATKDRERHAFEAVRARQETAETLKALEAARAKAKKREQAPVLQEQVVSVKKSLLRTGVFWVGLAFALIASLWQVFNVLWPLDKLEIGRAEAYLGAYGGMFGLGVPILIVGVMCIGRGLNQSVSGKWSWFVLGGISFVISLALSYFLPNRLQAGGTYSNSELLLPSVIGSALPFAFLGLYSLGGGLAQIQHLRKAAEKDNAKDLLKAVPARRPLASSILFWTGTVLLVGGLGWQMSTGLATNSPDEWLYWRIAFGLPFTISGSYCVGKAFGYYKLIKGTWFGTAAVVWLATALLLFIITGASLSGGSTAVYYLMLPVLLLAVLPPLILGLYCAVKGVTANRSTDAIPETLNTPQPGTRHFLFWSGSVLFVLSQAFYWAMFLWIMPLNGVNPHLFLQAVPVMATTIVGMGLIWLSRRKLRDGWFWLGSEIFAFGVGALPQWINIYLHIELFPPQTSPHDLSDIGVELGLTFILMALGSFFLWKGWPRIGVKNPLGEMLGFIITLSLVSLTVTIFLLAIAD